MTENIVALRPYMVLVDVRLEMFGGHADATVTVLVAPFERKEDAESWRTALLIAHEASEEAKLLAPNVSMSKEISSVLGADIECELCRADVLQIAARPPVAATVPPASPNDFLRKLPTHALLVLTSYSAYLLEALARESRA